MSNKTTISDAKLKLVLNHPFFASLVLNMPVKEDAGINTACTNGLEIRHNPAYIESLDKDEATGVLAHEVAHIMLLHHTRRYERNPKKWNEACDYAINPILLEDGFVLPEGALFKSEFIGKSAEEIYDLLPDGNNADDQSKDENGQGQGGSGHSDSGNDSGDSRIGDVEDLPVDQPSDIAQHEAEVRQAVSQAYDLAKKQGLVPAGMERLIDEILDPVMPWKEILSRFISEPMKSDYSWRMPNTRYTHLGVYLPELRNEELKMGVFMVDTSGSLGADAINFVGAEIKSLCQLFGQEMAVIYCDSEVAGVQVVDDSFECQVEPKGGGGTDFKPPFEYLEKEDMTPAWAVYYTDGECSSFPEEPDYPVLWLCTTKNFNPPFGEVIYKVN